MGGSIRCTPYIPTPRCPARRGGSSRRTGPGRGDGVARSCSGARLPTLLIAAFAVQIHPEPAASALGGQDPGPLHPGGLVPHVLRVAALQLGHPVALLIPVVAHDR